MLVRCREPGSSNGFGNQGGIAEFNPSLSEGRIFLLSPNRHDKTPSYTRGRHILLIEKERTSYDTMEMVWQPHPRIE